MAEVESEFGTTERGRAAAVAAAARRRAADLGVTLPDALRLWELAGPPSGEGRVGPVLEAADGLAAVLEAATPAADRQAKGLHVTPAWLADHLVGRALDGLAVEPRELKVCDPACGGGAFLLAAARALHDRGVDRSDIVRHLLWGADIDPVGLAAAEAELALWAGEAPPADHLVVGDVLLQGSAAWPEPLADGFTVVVGNPPFLNQLGRATVRTPGEVQSLRGRFGAAVQAYTDTAWLFLLLGVDLAGGGGRVALIQPLSLVGARDAAAVRSALDEQAELLELWVEPRRSFAASVHVCAPVLQLHPKPGPNARHSRRSRFDLGSLDGRRAPSGGTDWAGRLADAFGIPAVDSPAAMRLADRARVTAGFRDEYYGLVPLVREAEGRIGERPLITVGVLDWGRSRWGDRSTQFAKRRWTAPVVDAGRADPDDDSPAARASARWIERVGVPKVVVATQTRVVEAAVDEFGAWVPSVPALVVLPGDRHDPEELWRLAAAIAAPTSTAWLFRRAPGTALSRGALKIAARDLGELPLPVDTAAWHDAAGAFRSYVRSPASEAREAFDAFVSAAAAAYRADDAVVAWWRGQMRRPGSPNRFAAGDGSG